MYKNIFSFVLIFAYLQVPGQGVGIGTTMPNEKAALDIRSTSKGVLFPSLTTAQRDLITNPPDGLHIFNKDEKCLNYYDSLYGFWNCYCHHCETVVINITSSASNLDFYNVFGKFYTAKRFVVKIAEGATLKGESSAAIYFTGFPYPVIIRIINYGTIIGRAGTGGYGSTHYADPSCITYYPGYFPDALYGTNGGTAISAQFNLALTIDNYGVIGGGGGGGGGGGSLNNGGGGGGGGQGNYSPSIQGIPFSGFGYGGNKGYKIDVFCDIVGSAQDGGNGSLTTFGLGGAPSASNAWGGNGGGLGQAGQTGLGALNPGVGGQPGKAVSGGSGTIIHNFGNAQVFGIVD